MLQPAQAQCLGRPGLQHGFVDRDAQLTGHLFDQHLKPRHLVGQLLLPPFERFELRRRDSLVNGAWLPNLGLCNFTAKLVHPAAFTLARHARQLHDIGRIVHCQFVEKRYNG
ncbi:hypothetical protein NMT51_23795, partial [Escherichia coli]|nr:hypothetical protein [Escherichia coli]